MKRMIGSAVIAAILLCAAGNASAAQPGAAGWTELSPQPDEKSVNPFLGVGRGVANMLLCWVEVPRCLVYDNVKLYPVLGMFTGSVKGLLLTSARFLVGAVDVVTFGYTGSALFEPQAFPDYVWKAPWIEADTGL